MIAFRPNSPAGLSLYLAPVRRDATRKTEQVLAAASEVFGPVGFCFCYLHLQFWIEQRRVLKDKVLSVEGYLKQNSNPDIQCIYVIAGRIFAFITYKCRDILF